MLPLAPLHAGCISDVSHVQLLLGGSSLSGCAPGPQAVPLIHLAPLGPEPRSSTQQVLSLPAKLLRELQTWKHGMQPTRPLGIPPKSSGLQGFIKGNDEQCEILFPTLKSIHCLVFLSFLFPAAWLTSRSRGLSMKPRFQADLRWGLTWSHY